MKKIIVLSFLSFCMFISINAQEYFQQKVDYTIEVKLDDVNHFLTGNESFVYHNNSTTTLDFIYIHLWPNAYKDRSTALVKQQVKDGNMKLYNAIPEERGYIDSLDFNIDGKKAVWALDSLHIDICKMVLNEPLLPGKSITVTTPFRVKIPSASFSRLGHVEQSYQITQWYPKPAVYDVNGWHQMPYLNQGEFYSEFGTFDVSITLPKNYVVGSTGDLQNESEIQFLNKKAEETKTWMDNNEDLSGDNRPENDFPESVSETKTIQYLQQEVHDFAWFADKRYKVLKGEVELPHSKRKVTTWAMFTPKYSEVWRTSLEYLHDATYYYSLWNGDYEYNHVSAVDGTISAGGGMEYPNVTVIGTTGSKFQLEVVIMHEVGHNWFYGMLGSNEREHTWMDEGLNSFNESRYMDTKYPDLDMISKMMQFPLKTKQLNYREMDQLMYLFSARMHVDQPMETLADEFSPINYGMIAYKKSAVAFTYLKAYLGDEVFDQCMRKYFSDWKLKHPQPEDLEKIFTDISKKDLSWFFGDFIQTTKIVDYKMMSAKEKENGKFDVGVKNVGDIAGPYSISVLRDDSIVSTTWMDGIADGSKSVVEIDALKGDLIRIDATHQSPEFFGHNNTIKTKGLLKRVEPIRTQLVTGLEDDNVSNLFWTPIAGWNNYNKWMLGINFHNTPLPSRKFEYSLSPMYSIATKNLNGLGRITWYNRNSEIGVTTQKFNISTASFNKDDNRNYWKVKPYLIFKNLGKHKGQLFLSVNYLKFKHDYSFLIAGIVEENTAYSEKLVSEIEYSFRKKKLFSTFDLTVTAKEISAINAIVTPNIVFPLSAEVNYAHDYGGKKKQIKLRGFAGKMFTSKTDYNFVKWNTGGAMNVDYAYDDLYLGRNETDGFLSKQISNNQGGLRMWFGDYGNNMMFSGLVAFELPIKLPIEFFAGAAWSDDVNNIQTLVEIEPARNELNYNMGITFDVNFVRIHVPLLYSQPYSGDVKILEAISFEFNINDLNPGKLIRNNLK